jgi:hypothetical protein
MVRYEVNMSKSVKWSWFKVPATVKQINENLFTDTPNSSNIKSIEWHEDSYIAIQSMLKTHTTTSEC